METLNTWKRKTSIIKKNTQKKTSMRIEDTWKKMSQFQKKTLVSNKLQEKKIMYQGFYRRKSDETYKEKETQ